MLVAYTSKGYKFLLSIEDQPLLSLYTWVRTGRGYFHAKRYGKVIYLHRLVTECEDPKMVIDHLDGDPSNNQRSNLKIMTQAENMLNRKDSVKSRRKKNEV